MLQVARRVRFMADLKNLLNIISFSYWLEKYIKNALKLIIIQSSLIRNFTLLDPMSILLSSYVIDPASSMCPIMIKLDWGFYIRIKYVGYVLEYF